MDTLRLDRLVVSIFIIGVTLYLQMAWIPGFFHDGYLYAAFGKNAADHGYWLVPHLSNMTYSRFFHHTPFVFILEGGFFKVFGGSYLSARFFASLFSLGTGLLIFKFLKNLGKDKWASWALFLFFIIPPLIKKTRFPNLDLPLMLFFAGALTSYFRAYKKNQKSDWIFLGVLFGLSCLTKGPVAILIPFVIFIHLLTTRRIAKLLAFTPWVSLLLGLFIFSLWPLALNLTGNIDIFYKWVDFTFLETIKNGRGESSPFHTYLVFLLKQTAPLLILSFFSLKIVRKKSDEDKELLYFILTCFLGILIPLSIAKFKYSNYLIPLYPFYAMMAAYFLSTLPEMKMEKIFKGIHTLAIILPLIFLIFPLTNKIKRDPDLFRLRNILEKKEVKVDLWVNFKEAYPFWALANFNGWTDHSDTLNTAKLNTHILSLNSAAVKAFFVKKEDQHYFEADDRFKEVLSSADKTFKVYLLGAGT